MRSGGKRLSSGAGRRAAAVAILLWGLVVASRGVASSRPESVERLYSRHLYRGVARVLSSLFGALPFSVAEAVLAAGLVLLGAGAGAWLRRRGGWRDLRPVVMLARAAAVTAAVVLVFDVLWGFNYDREPVAALLGYDVSAGATPELAALTTDLLARSAALRDGLPEDAAGVLRLADGRRGALRRAARGYEALFAGPLPLPPVAGRPKLAAVSPLMSYLGISGIFVPFTGEATVNATLPDWELPFTTSHELAHQGGFAREDEANYVGYLACRAHPDLDFQYSGTFQAGLYALAALGGADRAVYARLRGGLPAPLRRDLAAAAAWRARYQSRLGEVQDRVNDAYLKTQGQRDGVRSYGRMVDLLLAERRAAAPPRPR